MLANEVRIGNYVLLDGCIEQIESINKVGINIFVDDDKLIEHATFDELKPIDITEDILSRFKFKSELGDPNCTGVLSPNGHYRLINNDDDLELDVLFGFFGNTYPMLVQVGDNNLPNIKYLHQLQNLYFALTNKELITDNCPKTFKSAARFDQMCSESQVYQEVRLYYQKAEDSVSVIPEIIFNLPLPLDFDYDTAQFSVKEEEAKMLINVFKTYFNLDKV